MGWLHKSDTFRADSITFVQGYDYYLNCGRVAWGWNGDCVAIEKSIVQGREMFRYVILFLSHFYFLGASSQVLRTGIGIMQFSWGTILFTSRLIFDEELYQDFCNPCKRIPEIDFYYVDTRDRTRGTSDVAKYRIFSGVFEPYNVACIVGKFRKSVLLL